MSAVLGSGIAFRRGAAAAFLLLASGFAASAAGVGGGFWPAAGPGRVALRGSDVRPLRFEANFRFSFDGAPGDGTGTGAVLAYDEAGQDLLASFPVLWTAVGRHSFRADIAGPEFEAFLAGGIADATGATVVVDLEEASVRGTVVRRGTAVRARIRALGTATLDGGTPVDLRGKLSLR
jgi:hypothetical protein